MNPVATDYLLPPEQDMDSIAAAIRAAFRCEQEPPASSERRFFDSFEWSLYQAGVALEEVSAAGRRELVWEDLADSGAVLARQSISTEPGLVAELPPGPVRERLAPVLGVRRLLALLTLASTSRTLRVLNADDKTVVRIVLEEARIVDDGPGHDRLLPARLRLVGVRGYQEEHAEVSAELRALLPLAPAHAPLLLEGLAAIGRRPGGYSSKLDYRLDPGERAEAATRTILLGLLDTIEANVDGTRRNLDPEFLHDLRVATRRTRSALGQIKGVLPAAIVADFKARFAWLQQVTGPVRDLDVYLLDFPTLKADLPAALREDLEPLKDWLAGHYDAAQRALADALAGESFARLLREWRAFLEAPSRPGADRAAKQATAPIKRVADKRIRRMHRRVLDEGRAITDASPSEELHELRKSCKKLRYLMEFFQSLYPAADIKELIKQMKLLLDNLGGFQDLAVQAAHLRETAAMMQAAGAAPLGTLLAMGALIGHMLEQQQRARREFARIFADFDSDANAALFAQLFTPPSALADAEVSA
jgi:CHAD domain-containing protein